MAITAQERTQIIELTALMFHAAPGATYLSQIVSLYEALGHNLQALANALGTTPAYAAVNPNFQTAEEFAASLLTPLGLQSDSFAVEFIVSRYNAGVSKAAIAYQAFAALNSVPSDAGNQYSAAKAALLNQTAVAEYYSVTKSVNETDLADLQAVLNGVTADPATVTAAKAAIDGTVVDHGQTFTLTANVDNVKVLTIGTVDTVVGVVDPAGTGSFTVGDNITGNGKTQVNLAVASTGTAPFATVTNVAAVNLTSGVTTGTLDINAVSWSSVGAVNLANGADGLFVDVSGLNAGADLSVGAGVGGGLMATYTNDLQVWMNSDRGSSISYVDGKVNGSVDAGGSSSLSVSAQADDTAITVGDVSITAAGSDGSDAYFGVFNTQDLAADITIGNVTMTGLTSNIWFTVENTNHTTDSDAANVTVGNVTLTGVGGADVSMSVSNTNSYGAVGNTSVGNVSLATGAGGSISATIRNDGVGAAGNLAVGDVTISGGKGAEMSISITNMATMTGTGTGDTATLGTTTVGNIGANVGQSGSLDISVSALAFADGGKATVGNVTVGAFTGVLAQAATVSYDIDVEASSTGAAASVGTVNVGAVNLTMAVDATADYSVSVTAQAAAGKAATVGDLTFGAVNVAAGINTSFDASFDVNALGSSSSAIGNLTTGAVTLAGDDGASLSYSLDVNSDGKIGNVSLGNTAVTLGVSASADVYGYFNAAKSIGNFTAGNVAVTGGVNSDFSGTISATATGGDLGAVTLGDLSLTIAKSGYASMEYEFSASNDIGNITVGNVTLSAAQNATVDASYSFSAWSGDVGNVTVGNVSATAAKGATADYYFSVEGETSIGTVTFGNATVSANGDGAFATAEFDVSNDSLGTIGAVTVGNVAVTANGAGAHSHYDISVTSAATGGALTVGDVAVNVGNAAAKTGALGEVDINNGLGAVVVGNITLTSSGVRDVADTTDLRTYDADVTITAATTVTVGNITVTGGNSSAEDFDVLTNWLTLNGTKKTIGAVDYSGYGAAATIDVSGFSGAASITGTAKGDTITDNKGVNSITGGAGADKFVFLDTNTGMTLATVDTITDFSNTAGDKIDVSPVLTVDEYGEATYSDFAAFLSGAAAANKDVFVGQIGGDSFVAVDNDADNVVEFVIKLSGVSLAQIDVASFI